jgi:hypothetical protein
MSKGASRPRWIARGARTALLVVLLAVPVLAMAACGGEEPGEFTPPPATIIRAGENGTPTAPEQGGAPASSETLPAAPSATPEGYPMVAITPQPAVTPEPYPTQ